MNISIKKAAIAMIYVLLISAFCILLFWRLGDVSVENWDEARHGISAYEMLQTGNYIENTFSYEKDTWNLKPPLSFWAEALSFRMLGYNPLAFRLPSAISFLAMFLVLAYVLHKNYGCISAICFMMAFIAFRDFFVSHFGRSGDADALFNLFVVLCAVSLFCFSKTQKIAWVMLSGFCASLAFMSKSFHAVIAYGIIGLFLILSGSLKKFRVKDYISVGTASAVVPFVWGG